MADFPGETPRDRRRQWYVGIATVVALLGIVINTLLVGLLIKTGNENHTAVTALDNKIVKLDNKIVSLEKQHGADILNESQLLTRIGEYAVDLTNTVNAICAHTQCNTPIPLLFPTTTTTTVPHVAVTPRATIAPRIAPIPSPPVTTVPTRGRGHVNSHARSHK